MNSGVEPFAKAGPTPQASKKVIISQLRQLERDGIVGRHVHYESILRTHYAVTQYGRTLRPALIELARWRRKHNRLATSRAATR